MVNGERGNVCKPFPLRETQRMKCEDRSWKTEVRIKKLKNIKK